MSFEGFQPEVADFFSSLRRSNDKGWFDLHRAEWIELVKQPLEDLLAEAEPVHGSGRVMRINRDVRFSADKSPYRTSCSMWAGGVGGVYLSVSDAGLEVGGGLYEPSRDQLARARTRIDERPQVAAALQHMLDELTAFGFEIQVSLTVCSRTFVSGRANELSSETTCRMTEGLFIDVLQWAQRPARSSESDRFWSEFRSNRCDPAGNESEPPADRKLVSVAAVPDTSSGRAAVQVSGGPAVDGEVMPDVAYGLSGSERALRREAHALRESPAPLVVDSGSNLDPLEFEGREGVGGERFCGASDCPWPSWSAAIQ